MVDFNKITENCANYFNPAQSPFKRNEGKGVLPHTPTTGEKFADGGMAALKVISYCTVIIPAIVGLVYGIATLNLKNRVSVNDEDLSPKTGDITRLARERGVSRGESESESESLEEFQLDDIEEAAPPPPPPGAALTASDLQRRMQAQPNAEEVPPPPPPPREAALNASDLQLRMKARTEEAAETPMPPSPPTPRIATPPLPPTNAPLTPREEAQEGEGVVVKYESAKSEEGKPPKDKGELYPDAAATAATDFEVATPAPRIDKADLLKGIFEKKPVTLKLVNGAAHQLSNKKDDDFLIFKFQDELKKMIRMIPNYRNLDIKAQDFIDLFYAIKASEIGKEFKILPPISENPQVSQNSDKKIEEVFNEYTAGVVDELKKERV